MVTSEQRHQKVHAFLHARNLVSLIVAWKDCLVITDNWHTRAVCGALPVVGVPKLWKPPFALVLSRIWLQLLLPSRRSPGWSTMLLLPSHPQFGNWTGGFALGGGGDQG